MTDEKIISLAKETNDGRLQNQEQALKDALNEIGKRGAFKNGKKILILALDDGKNGDEYGVSFIQGGMTMSQCIALCEVAKTIFLTEMEFI
jgi:hypothetical protein